MPQVLQASRREPQELQALLLLVTGQVLVPAPGLAMEVAAATVTMTRMVLEVVVVMVVVVVQPWR